MPALKTIFQSSLGFVQAGERKRTAIIFIITQLFRNVKILRKVTQNSAIPEKKTNI